MRITRYFSILLVAFAIGCGDDSSSGPTIDSGTPGGGDGSTPGSDGSTPGSDGGLPGGDGGNAACTPQGTQCNNCVDDDGDGLRDGFDPHCISALDNDESSFATGIPGDNMDEAKQDCFFDGNSGGGDDGCDVHVCCLLSGECPPDLSDGYNPDNCDISQRCIDNCGPITPPGCDCFSCCTICADGECHDVLTNPAVSPNCDVDTLDDPEACRPCTKVASCGTTCEPSGCILCPGQTEEDLPPECNEQNQCPDGQQTCATSSDCPDDLYCATGCCIGFIVN